MRLHRRVRDQQGRKQNLEQDHVGDSARGRREISRDSSSCKIPMRGELIAYAIRVVRQHGESARKMSQIASQAASRRLNRRESGSKMGSAGATQLPSNRRKASGVNSD